MSIFVGPLTSIAKADLDRLIADRVSEDLELEFKQALPSNRQADPWYQSQGEVGDKAKIEIVAEIIAFANTGGGILILGMAESGDKPPRATEIFSLPKCHDLADRFRNICRDMIDPRLSSIEIEGIETETGGAGVVIFRVGSSASGPHRHTKTKECYQRLGDRCEAMNMTEVQQHALRADGRAGAVDAAIGEAHARFNSFLSTPLQDYPGLFGALFVAHPVMAIQLPRIFPEAALRPTFEDVEVAFGPTAAFKLDMPIPRRETWRPMIGGIWIEGGNDHFRIRSELRDTGEISYLFKTSLIPPGERAIYPSNFMAIVCNGLISTDVVRTFARSTVGYAIQITLECRAHDADLMGYGGRGDRKFGTLAAGTHPLPRYLTSSRDDWTRVASEVETDLWYAAHEAPMGHRIEIKRA